MGCILGKEVLSQHPSVGDREGRHEEEGEDGILAGSFGNKANGGLRRVEENVLQTRDKMKVNPRLSNPHNHIHGEQVAAGWPSWLSAVAGEAINGWTPRCADSFEKIDKIGQGTYSNVYKAKDAITGNIVALKKVRFDDLEPDTLDFMAREILILRRLDHPNIVKLQGLALSRMSYSLYLVFDYMEHDLAGLISSPEIKFTEAQIKCYMHQLLSGLEHCHNCHVLHRDIKGSNLLIDDKGVLRIADFGLACNFDPNHKQPMTSCVVTLWYRPPELLLGATDYGVGVDLWSAGCILAELFARKPIMTGRTEVEQLHKIFKLCGSPSEDYWKKLKLPAATVFKPQQSYTRCINEIFTYFPQSCLSLIDTLLAIDPSERRTAKDALRSEFFTTKPYACDPSDLPKYPPSKEMDAKRHLEARRSSAASKNQADGATRSRSRRVMRALPAPRVNAELQMNIERQRQRQRQRQRLVTQGNAMSRSEKFPPPHEDGGLNLSMRSSNQNTSSFDPQGGAFHSLTFSHQKEGSPTWSGPLIDPHNHGDVAISKSKPRLSHGKKQKFYMECGER